MIKKRSNIIFRIRFLNLTRFLGFFGSDLGLESFFGLGQVQAYSFGFGPEQVGPFTSLPLIATLIPITLHNFHVMDY